MKLLPGKAVNVSSGATLAHRIRRAETPAERMRGLLGLAGLPAGEALLLSPCRAIHTLGMRFPLDALFLDGSGRIVRAERSIRPNRLMVASWRAHRTLELPAGVIESSGSRVGDQVRLEGEAVDPPKRLHHQIGNLLLGLVFTLFASLNLVDLLKSPTFSELALVFINGLAATLFCLRRKAARVTPRSTDWAVTVATLAIPWGLRGGGTAAYGLSLSGNALQAIGLLVVLFALMSLGRSFGLLPANRGVVEWGLYRWVRHPMYAGELLFFLGFGLINPAGWNAILITALWIGLPLRAFYEERLLVTNRQYQDYADRVPGRFIPGIL